MSHIQGTDYVGSMVVIEDALPKKSQYRRFKVRDVPGNDDFAAMREVLTRRLTAYLEERGRPVARADGPVLVPAPAAAGRRRQGSAGGGRGGRGARPRRGDPGGGPGQALRGGVRPGAVGPGRIPRQSEALYLLQRVRDEAHRFAITYHRRCGTSA